ncbi:DeoR/GlpR transcriptional regulator [Paraburkholderia sp. Ac-20340]|uniref:DeoR/GlpR family DNA-binding transcription regulator n=1 Tax=Paraburkholderia sp. Ac-20340 TaxID=2703888 RepID=UPI00197DAF88|nr:DeoR/GlpR family DNA-binding transcription regulator [Paraburkholderia sp. Ac-20340]MBN3851837.1 DeoR/GlpR transcriptional regulator [Paraburkholderia sp. Ac-20340]
MTDDIPIARRELIASRLAAGQAVVAATLAAEFEVSEDAIRRDLRALAAEGLCRRVYGGALPVSPASAPMAARMDEARERKQALAAAAVTQVQRGELLFLDSGSTNLALVDMLPEDFELTVATNSIDIAAALLRRADIRLIVMGGEVNPVVGGSVDAAAVASVQNLHIDRCFLGACAVSAQEGVSAYEFADATFKRIVLSRSRHTIILSMTDKIEAHASHRVAALDAVACLVVEHDVARAQIAALRKAGTTVLQAQRPASE